jgi:tetratricopeptide (TPR) repeat protein
MRLSSRYIAALALIAWMLLPSIAIACMWDYDTIKMERTRFPGTLELITGKFLRHSPEFYQWRIVNRLNRLKSYPNDPALLDDLAVAYDKTSQHEKAIETAIETEKLHPGRYETAANLATFYFHSGKLTEGIPHIDRALKINPDAHFGREKYQKLLVEYVLQQRKGGPLELPLSKVIDFSKTASGSPSPLEVTISETFADYIHPGRNYESLTQEEAEAAIKGILGMMKFGKHDSPVLLEALGSLLTQGEHNPKEDAKLLACRAYLKAAYEVPEDSSRTAYRAMALRVLKMQRFQGNNDTPISLETVEIDFKKELEEARSWYVDLRERELSWIRDGKDPETEFDKLYVLDPEVSGMDVQDPLTPDERFRLFAPFIIVFGLILVLATLSLGALVIHKLIHRAAKHTRSRLTRNG